MNALVPTPTEFVAMPLLEEIRTRLQLDMEDLERNVPGLDDASEAEIDAHYESRIYGPMRMILAAPIDSLSSAAAVAWVLHNQFHAGARADGLDAAALERLANFLNDAA